MNYRLYFSCLWINECCLLSWDKCIECECDACEWVNETMMNVFYWLILNRYLNNPLWLWQKWEEKKEKVNAKARGREKEKDGSRWRKEIFKFVKSFSITFSYKKEGVCKNFWSILKLDYIFSIVICLMLSSAFIVNQRWSIFFINVLLKILILIQIIKVFCQYL